jgi:hypothetical protein
MNLIVYGSLETKLHSTAVLNISTITFVVTVSKPTGCFYELYGTFCRICVLFSKIANFGPMNRMLLKLLLKFKKLSKSISAHSVEKIII